MSDDVQVDDGLWGELRSLLADGPSGWAWARLWAWLDAHPEASEDARVVTYLAGHLERWPEAVRVMPASLWARIEQAQEHPLLPLCPVWRRWDPERLDMQALLWHPQRHTARVLDLSLKRAEEILEEDLAQLVADPAFDTLRELWLDDTPLWWRDESEGFVHLLHSAWRLPGLRALSMSGLYITDVEALALAEGAALVSLTTLCLQRTCLSGEGIAQLIRGLPALEVLRISAASGHVIEAGEPSTDQAFTRLHTLELCGPVASWPALLAALPRPPALRELAVGEPGSSPVATLQALAAAGWLDGLEVLRLVDGCIATASLPDALLKALPEGCQVILHTQAPDAAPRHEGAVHLLADLGEHTPEQEAGSGWWSWSPGARNFVDGRRIERHDEWPLHAQAEARPVIPRVAGGLGATVDRGVRRAREIVGDVALETMDVLSVDCSDTPEQLRDAFVAAIAPHVPALRTLLWHDCDDMRRQPSWLQSCDLAPVLHALPQLHALALKAGFGSRFAGLSHGSLRVLIVQCGGMSRELLDDLLAAELPELTALELWFGSLDYGCELMPEHLLPLLSGELFPKLRYLGLCNAPWADRMVELLHGAPVLRRVETLDLSRGTLSNAGLRALARADLSALRRVDVRRTFVSDRAQLQRLAQQGPQLTGSTDSGGREPLEADAYVSPLYVESGE